MDVGEKQLYKDGITYFYHASHSFSKRAMRRGEGESNQSLLQNIGNWTNCASGEFYIKILGIHEHHLESINGVVPSKHHCSTLAKYEHVLYLIVYWCSSL